MARASSPTIRELRVRTVRVPLTEPHRTASGVVAESPLVLTDAITASGIVGRSIAFTYTSAALEATANLIRNIEPLLKGEPLAPAEIEQKLARRFRLLGTQGLVGMALAAIELDDPAAGHAVDQNQGRIGRGKRSASIIYKNIKAGGIE